MGKATVYLIRHGEKDAKDAQGEDAIGLSAIGENRAYGLVKVFSKKSDYKIHYILAQDYNKKNGHKRRPYDTVKPLADSLDLKVDHSIDRDDAPGVAKAIKDYDGKGNILVCWEHKQLNDIAIALGIKDAAEYPSDRFDVIWTVDPPYDQINATTSEHVPKLDDAHVNEP